VVAARGGKPVLRDTNKPAGSSTVTQGQVLLGDPKVHRLVRELADVTALTAGLAVLQGAEIEYVACARYVARPGPAADMELGFRNGTRRPAYCTAAGKVLLAHETPERVDAILTDVVSARRGANTITDPDRLIEELASVRKRGIATDNQESAIRLVGIAAPVHDAESGVVAALDLYTSTSRCSPRELEERGELDLIRTAEHISNLLGYAEECF